MFIQENTSGSLQNVSHFVSGLNELNLITRNLSSEEEGQILSDKSTNSGYYGISVPNWCQT